MRLCLKNKTPEISRDKDMVPNASNSVLMQDLQEGNWMMRAETIMGSLTD